MTVRSLVTTRGVVALAMAASFLIGVHTMALGGFGLNPFADIAHLGSNIGSLFGNQDPGQQPGVTAGLFPNYGTGGGPAGGGVVTQQAGPVMSPYALNIANNPSTPQSQTTPSTSSNGTLNVAPVGTVGAGMNQSAYQDAIQQQYGNAIQGYTGEKANAMAANPVNLQDVQNVFDLQKNQAQNQVGNQINTYNTQKSGIQSQQQLSLAQLADMIRGQHQGLQAQLGATGAGSSSAGLMGDYALARQQNQNAAAINTQAGGNIANVNAQIQQVQGTLDPYLQTLEGQKNQQLHNIMSNFNDLMSRLESSIGQAQGEEKARLALFGQTLTQAASDSIAALNQGVSQQKQAYLDSINNAKNAAPAYQAPALQEAPAPVTAPNLSPFQINSGAGNATAEPIGAGGSLASILRQQQQQAIA